MVDIVLRGAQGVPEGAYVSIRVGDVRRQMQFKPGSRFRFDDGSGPPRNFTVDVFEKVASGQVGIGELPVASSCGRKEGCIEVFRGDGGSSMEFDLEVVPLGPCDWGEAKSGEKPKVAFPSEEQVKSLRQQAASKARGYLQGHSVQKILHSMVESLLDRQPEDPIRFMSLYLQDVSNARPRTAPAKGEEAPAKPEEPPPEVAGREEEGEAEVPVPWESSSQGRSPEAARQEEEPPEAVQQQEPPSDVGIGAAPAFLVRGSPCEDHLASLAEFSREDQSSATDASGPEMPGAEGSGAAALRAEASGARAEDPGAESSDLGEESDEEYGFPTDVCPEALPDLRKHCSLAAELLRAKPAIYDNLRGVQTLSGISLARCIKPAMDVRGHPLLPTVGVVAGDAACYEAFAELFDPLVAELYSLDDPRSMRHPHDMDPTKVKWLPIDPSGKHVLGVRVRGCRNLSGSRMAPACSSSERRQVESLLVEALTSAAGELRGRYCPLPGSESHPSSSLTMEEEYGLAKARLLVAEPDSEIAVASGFARGWPDARGLFVSEDQRFVASINEEDHLSFTVLDPGGDLKKAFSLVHSVHCALEDHLRAHGESFALSKRLGFLGVCPARLGTCLAVTVALELPRLAGQRAELEAICQNLGVRIRPHMVQGKSSSRAASFDIFLQDLLSVSEVQQVTSVLEACRILVAVESGLEEGEELSLEETAAAVERARRYLSAGQRLSADASTLLKPDTPPPGILAVEVLQPECSSSAAGLVWEDGGGSNTPSSCSSASEGPEELPDLQRHHSLMTDVLEADPSIYARLRQVRTRLGVTLARCIRPGMAVKGHPLIKTVGAVAGDAECYEAFGEMLQAVAQRAHPGWSPEASQPSNLDASLVGEPRPDRSGAHVLRAQVSLRRNLEGLRFLPACSPEERKEAERLLCRAVGQHAGGLDGEYMPLRGMAPALQRELLKEGLLFQEPDAMLAEAAGTARGWPQARGLFLSRGRELVAWINEEDHLRLWSAEPSGDLAAAFRRLCAAEARVSAALGEDGQSFVRHPRLGYLTTCPSHLGTALRAEVRLKLPLLGAQPGFRALCRRLGLKATEASGLGGGAWDVANGETLGSGEAEQVNAVLKAGRLLVELEERLELGKEVDLASVTGPGAGSSSSSR